MGHNDLILLVHVRKGWVHNGVEYEVSMTANMGRISNHNQDSAWLPFKKFSSE